jgi:hypothetical protein
MGKSILPIYWPRIGHFEVRSRLRNLRVTTFFPCRLALFAPRAVSEDFHSSSRRTKVADVPTAIVYAILGLHGVHVSRGK